MFTHKAHHEPGRPPGGSAAGDLTPPARRHRVAKAAAAGFTLIELLIVVIILGVLLAVAYPSYLDSVRKGRRADGIAALTALQQAQERYRANSPVYGNLNSPADAATLPDAERLKDSPNKRYTLAAVPENNGAGYTLVATAVGAQAEDSGCKLMGVRARVGNLRYGSGSSSIDWDAVEPDAGRCWAK
jgi:type IV pilus assembly protein PilE